MHTTDKSITIEPLALERCFLVADILAEVYERPLTEYGLMGLSTNTNCFHIVQTPLLPQQRVTASSVLQSGYDVLALRREVQILSRRHQQQLIPVAFIHRHPSSSCEISSIDSEFLTTVLIDQISTVLTLRQHRRIKTQELDCGCILADFAEIDRPRLGDNIRPVTVEYGMCFSIIVSRNRDFAVFGARKLWCPLCGRPSVRRIDASLSVSPARELTYNERDKLRKQLEVEIEAKICLEKQYDTMEQIE